MSDNRNNQNNQNNNNKNNKRLNGLFVLIAWTVGLTILMNYFSAWSAQTKNAAVTHEIMYSQLKEMVKADQVEKVVFADGMIEITRWRASSTRRPPRTEPRWPIRRM